MKFAVKLDFVFLPLERVPPSASKKGPGHERLWSNFSDSWRFDNNLHQTRLSFDDFLELSVNCITNVVYGISQMWVVMILGENISASSIKCLKRLFQSFEKMLRANYKIIE